jgi:hypothetical protein
MPHFERHKVTGKNFSGCYDEQYVPMRGATQVTEKTLGRMPTFPGFTSNALTKPCHNTKLTLSLAYPIFT